MQIIKKLSLLLLAVFVVVGCDPSSSVQHNEEQSKITPALKERAQKMLQRAGKPIPGQYIVVYEAANGKAKMTASMVRSQTQAIQIAYHITDTDLKSLYAYSIHGFAAELTKKQLKKLKNDPRVEYIEQDRIVQLTPPHAQNMDSIYCIFFGIGCETGSTQPQVIPYGVQRVGGPATVNVDNKVWVIDTGIDLDHPDLNVKAELSAEFLPNSDSPNDLNGHGTHVAGIIAAIDNDVGVVGVAPGAPVVAVKVLNRYGSGSFSSVIAGVDYVAAHAAAGDVVNMSLGGAAPSSFRALAEAIKNAASQGIYFAISAGNASAPASQYAPARVDGENIYTVSAINSLDEFASFSNYGNPPVDFAAPGVGIKSLWKNGGTNTVSGTSQAAPHVAGVLLVTNGQPSTDGTAEGDPDGHPDPIVHL